MTHDSDLDDLLGVSPQPVRRGPGRPKGSGGGKGSRSAEPRGARRTGAKPVRELKLANRSKLIPKPAPPEPDFETTLEGAKAGDSLPRFEAFWKPVGISFLANVFRLSNSTVARKKLAECSFIDEDEFGNPLYDFVEAAGHLAAPRGKHVVAMLRKMGPSELPPQLSLAVQKAKNEELTYKVRAGELWHTADVLDVLGEVFLMMKNTMQLWVETLNDKGDLTKEQWEALSEMVYGLQTEMHEKLVEFAQRRSTYAVIGDTSDDGDTE